MVTRSEQVSRIKTSFQDSIALKQRMIETQLETIAQMAEVICESVEQGGKVLLCGNGGSAADAQHLAAELVVRLRPQVSREGIPASALATDTSSLTACSNDHGFEVYYERMTRTHPKARPCVDRNHHTRRIAERGPGFASSA